MEIYLFLYNDIRLSLKSISGVLVCKATVLKSTWGLGRWLGFEN